VTPLTDLGPAHYLGFPGGLYPQGKNSRPSAHENAGVTLGRTVQPLDKTGKPSHSGKIVMLCIGISNASREFSEFIRLVEADSRKNPSLLLLDAALEGASASLIAAPAGNYWKHVDGQLQRSQISPAQVQLAWIKPGEGYEARGFPENARAMQGALRSIVEILPSKFPLLKLVYISSRVYGGYGKDNLNPEPIAYESGFGVKWMIEERINSPDAGKLLPWVSWGPYLWADGLTPRSDGLVWQRRDFLTDGAHPSIHGARKVAGKLFEFFESDPTAQPWFFAQPGERKL
jgi:hypothetical protein